ncbi:MAG TPA: 2Fe-2S iron-sulfur cluster-binding protein [Anaerolineaceae bacterium]
MATEQWNVIFHVFRQKGDEPSHFDTFTLAVNPDEYVLDAVERVWAFHDRSLVYRHACHHSTCGACGMRVNGVEKLTCITPIREVTRDGGEVKIEPLRNFPVVSDLTVDMTSFYQRMELAHYPPVTPVAEAPLASIPPVNGIHPAGPLAEEPSAQRLNDCIECGMCISACPIATTTPSYLGPAILAAVQYQGLRERPDLAPLADQEDGVWRCHSVYECTAVCPSFVDPAWRIMDLRRQVVGRRIGRFFGRKEASK